MAKSYGFKDIYSLGFIQLNHICFVMGLLVSLGIQYAYSAETRAVEWTDMDDLDLRSALRAQYESHGNLFDPVISNSSIELALRDGEHKIGNEFHIPAILRPSVNFWLKVYTLYSTQHIVIFDANDQDIVYEVIDLRELANTARNQVVYEIVSKNRVDKAIALYRKAFAALAKNPHPRNPSREQKIVLARLQGNSHHHTFRELGVSLKTQRGQRDNLIKGLLDAESFFPKMELIFTGMNVPPELIRLSLVESSFNLKATSKVGASGVWQFMPSIGKKYLILDDQKQIDERRSPLKSTVAAAKMLKWNYQYLGSWVLAVIAYNHGLRHLPRLKGKNADFAHTAQLFDGKKSALGWASRSYYSEFLAVLYAEKYRDAFFGKIPSTTIRPISFEQLPKNETALNYVMDKTLSLNEFRLLNADIEDIHEVLPKGYWVVLPGTVDNIHEFVHVTLNNMKRLNVSSAARGGHRPPHKKAS